MTIQPEIVNWVERRAEWNLQPQEWETEDWNKERNHKIETALTAIATVATLSAIAAVAVIAAIPTVFHVTIFAASLLVATISIIGARKLIVNARNTEYWKDPDYCERRGRNALNRSVNNFLIGDPQYWDDARLSEVAMNRLLIEKGILKEDDFREIPVRIMSDPMLSMCTENNQNQLGFITNE